MESLTSLTSEQRMDMIMKGMKPNNPEEVKKYLQGFGLSEHDKILRAKELFKSLPSNLGGGAEVIPNEGEEYNEQAYTPRAIPQQNLRQQLQEDFEGYGVSAGKVFNTDDFVSLKKSRENPVGSVLNKDAIHEGFELSKAYLNLFVTNLQASDMNTSFKNRMELYKALKICLETESKYKSNPEALKKFRSGVLQAEKAMLKKLQS